MCGGARRSGRGTVATKLRCPPPALTPYREPRSSCLRILRWTCPQRHSRAMKGAAPLAAPRRPRLFGPRSAQETVQVLRPTAAQLLRRALPEANERARSVCGQGEPAVQRLEHGRHSRSQPCLRLRRAPHDRSRRCRFVAVQAHGEAVLPAGALHGLSSCGLTFELRRPARHAALGRQRTMSLRRRGRPRVACLAGSPLERGVRRHRG